MLQEYPYYFFLKKQISWGRTAVWLTVQTDLTRNRRYVFTECWHLRTGALLHVFFQLQNQVPRNVRKPDFTLHVTQCVHVHSFQNQVWCKFRQQQGKVAHRHLNKSLFYCVTLTFRQLWKEHCVCLYVSLTQLSLSCERDSDWYFNKLSSPAAFKKTIIYFLYFHSFPTEHSHVLPLSQSEGVAAQWECDVCAYPLFIKIWKCPSVFWDTPWIQFLGFQSTLKLSKVPGFRRMGVYIAAINQMASVSPDHISE